MNKAMMPSTQQDQVVERRETPIHPMQDVMRIDETCVGTTRILTMRISDLERSTQRTRYCSRLPANIHWRAVRVFFHTHETCVTRNAPHHLGRDAGLILDFAATIVRFVEQYGLIHVNGDERTVGTHGPATIARHECLCHERDRVGIARSTSIERRIGDRKRFT
jgi:hypothetical protein